MFARRARTLAPFALVVALAATAVVAAPAAAAPGDDVLLFSNPNVVDSGPISNGGELRYLSDQLESIGLVVTEFDGGDGTAGAWTTALAGIETVVFPESEEGDLFATGVDATDAWLSDAAAAVLATWVQAGGTILFSGQDGGQQDSMEGLLTILTGVDFTGSWGDNDGGGSAARVIADAALPNPLPYANGTYAPNTAGWSGPQSALLTPWYEDGDYLWAGELAAASGTIAILAYDYYPRPGDDDPLCAITGDSVTLTYQWNQVLSALVDGGPASLPVTDPWTGDGFPVSITVETGDILGSGEWDDAGPAVWQAIDRPVGSAVEIDRDDFVENPSGYDGCVAVDVDPEAQTITIVDLAGGSEYGALRLELTSMSIASVELVTDELIDYSESDWALDWSFAASTLSASWQSEDLSLYDPDERAGGAESFPDTATVFSYELRAPELAATGADIEASTMIAVGAAFLTLGLGAIAWSRRRSRARTA